MANVNIKPAASGNYTHKYAPLSAITFDFGDLACSRCTEVEKGDRWNYKQVKSTLRVAPSVFPAYGRLNFKTAAFFVPCSQLIESYDSFRDNKVVWKGKYVRMPYFIASDINEFFWTHRQGGGSNTVLSTVAAKGANAATLYSGCKNNGIHWDLVYYDSNDTAGDGNKIYFLALTPFGKRYYKTLKELGYDFASYTFYTTGDADILASVNTHVNALPFLAYMKCYCDYFLNPHFYNTTALTHFLQSVHDSENYNDGNLVYYNGHIDDNTIFQLLSMVLIPLEHNMYLDAWNSPNSPTGVAPDSEMISSNPSGVVSPYIPNTEYGAGGGSNVSLKEFVSSDSDTTSIHTDYVSNPGTNALQALSQLGLNWLNAIYKIVKRNNVAGSKPIQQLLARFGDKSSDWNTHFVHKLFEGQNEVDFSAVVSQTDSALPGSGGNPGTGKSLGSYAGFAASGLQFNFKYRSSDHGYIIVLHWVQIVPMLRHGYDPQVLRINPYDWYTPEFDGKTIRAIPQMEISQDKGSGLVGYNGDKKIFGFTDIYDEYREMRDMIAGDFITDENGVDQFLFARDLSYYRELANIALQPQTARIQYYSKGGTFPDFTNPFQWSPVDGDRFFLYVRYDITANRRIKSKSEALDLNGEGDMSIEYGGEQMR